jgi:hypothetical protein
MTATAAREKRAEAQAVFDSDYSMAEAARALQLVYEATQIERELGLPPQTDRKTHHRQYEPMYGVIPKALPSRINFSAQKEFGF